MFLSKTNISILMLTPVSLCFGSVSPSLDVGQITCADINLGLTQSGDGERLVSQFNFPFKANFVYHTLPFVVSILYLDLTWTISHCHNVTKLENNKKKLQFQNLLLVVEFFKKRKIGKILFFSLHVNSHILHVKSHVQWKAVTCSYTGNDGSFFLDRDKSENLPQLIFDVQAKMSDYKK